MKKTYEIHDLTTNEILADNLNFDNMPELFLAYCNFYNGHDIVSCYRTHKTQPIKLRKEEFLNEWLDFVEVNAANFY